MPVYVRLQWPVLPAVTPLTKEAGERITSYITRYAQTLSVPVRETEFHENQMVFVVELPPSLSLNQVTTPLGEASARFARETLGLAGFAWATEAARADSIAAPRQRDTAGKTHDDDELPAWLTSVLAQQKKGTGK